MAPVLFTQREVLKLKTAHITTTVCVSTRVWSVLLLTGFVFLGAAAAEAASTNYIVTTTADSGAGSLRQAISDANSNPGLDSITFSITGSAPPHTIQLVSPLPNITDPVAINGTTQPDYAGSAVIELNGANAGPAAAGFHIMANGCTVKGLIIHNFANDGILVDTASGNVLGDTNAALANVIASNALAGVAILSGTNNAIFGNSIYDNQILGIDLGADGVTTNDNNDLDTGANNLQNFPLLTSANASSSNTVVQGEMSSKASTAYRLEFFANTVCDVSGYGQGESPAGATNVTTGASGTNNFTIMLPYYVPGGMYLTATATDPFNNTSEFSPCVLVTGVSGMRVATGSYVGNSQATRSITGLGFQPALVILKAQDSTSDSLALTRTMVSLGTKELGDLNAMTLGLIKTLDADGFTVGSDKRVNTNGVSYSWVAFSESPGEMQVGTYAGNGVNGREVTGLGFRPDYVAVLHPGGFHSIHRFPTEAVGRSSNFHGQAELGIGVWDFTADGFTVANDTKVNASGTTYHYYAFKAIPGQVAGGQYTGSGTATNILGLGFQPQYVMIKSIGGTQMVHHPDSLPGDATFLCLAGAPFAGGIQSFLADGFRVGTDATVGTSAGTYFWMAFRDAGTTASADLVLSQLAAPNPVIVGNNLTYSLTVTNISPSPATAVTLLDPLPPGLTFVSAVSSQGTCSNLASTVTCNLATLPVGGNAVVTIVANASTAGSITNTATVTEAELEQTPLNNTATTITTISPRANLGVSQTVAPNPVIATQASTFSIIVTNAGPSTSTAATLTDTLPASLIIVSATSSQGMVTTNGNQVTASLASLLAGRSATVNLTVQTTVAGTVNNTVSVSGPETDPVAGNNSATTGLTVNPMAELSVAVTNAPNPTFVSGPLTSTVTVVNNGPSTATGTVVTNTLPAGVIFRSANASVGTATPSSGLVVWNIGNRNSGASATLTIVVTPNSVGTATDTATVGSGVSDLIPGNNTASAATTVNPGADLAISVIGLPNPVVRTDVITYSLTVTNRSGADAPSVTVTNTLPPGLSLDSAAAPNGYSVAGSVITLNFGTVAANSSAAAAIIVTVDTEGSLTNNAAVSSSVPDGAPVNNTATTVTTASPLADLGVTLTGPAGPLVLGTQITLNMVVTNQGPSSAPSVTLTNQLPDGLVYLSATTSQGSFAQSHGVVTFNVGTIVAGGSATASILVNCVGPGDNSSVATVTSAAVDRQTANNSDSYSITLYFQSGNWMTSGSFIGDGSTNRTVSGLGFTPDVVIIKANNLQPAFIRTSTMALNQSKALDAAGGIKTDGILSFAPGGFVVGANNGVNESGKIIYWVAFRQTASQLRIGKYTGDGTDSRNIAGVGFQPDYVLALDGTGGNANHRFPGMVGDASLAVHDGSPRPNYIQAILADGFQVGSQNPVNHNGDDIHYVAFRNVAGQVAGSNYVGNGLSPRNITGVGFQPDFVFVQAARGGVGVVHRSATLPGSESQSFLNTINTTDGILQLQADGFQVGTGNSVNDTNGATIYYMAFKNAPSTPQPDLVVSATATPDPASITNNLTYSLSVANIGTLVATNVTVTNTLPDSVTFLSVTSSVGTCTQIAGVVTCNLGNFDTNSNDTVSIVVVPLVAGTITNAATAIAQNSDLSPANNTAITITTVNGLADLGLTQTVSTNAVYLGANVTYTFTITNTGPSAAAVVLLSDVFPANVSYKSASASQGSVTHSGSSLVTANLGSLPAGSNATVTVVMTANSVGSITNTATVSSSTADPNAGNNSASTVLTVNPVADVQLSVTDSPDKVYVGNNLTYTFKISNKGPSPATGVSFTNALPATVTFISATASQGTASQSGGIVTANLGTLAHDANATVTVIVAPKVSAAGILTNTASAAAVEYDSLPANNTTSISSTVLPDADLSVGVSATPNPVPLGQTITYTIVVTNNGPNTATSVAVKAEDPSQLTYQSGTASQGACTPSGDKVICTLGTMTNGAIATVTLVFTASSTGTFNYDVGVAATEADLASANDSAAISTTVSPATDIAVSQSVALIASNATFQMTLTVTNLGPAQANSITLTDSLPAELTFVSASVSQGTRTQALGTVTASLGALSPGRAATVTIVATPNTAGLIVNTATVTATEFDPQTANNTATATFTGSSADMGVTVTASPGTHVAGQPFQYLVTVINDGPLLATGVMLTNTLPGGVTLGAISLSQGTQSQTGNVLICAIGSLSAGASATLSINLTASTSGSFTNTAIVSATQPDPATLNNSAFAVADVAPAADLAVSLSRTPATVYAGSNVTYLVTVTNNGPAAATGVQVTSVPSADAAIVSAATGTGTAFTGGGLVIWQVDSLSSAGSATLTLVVTAPAGGNLTNVITGIAVEADLVPANNTVTNIAVVNPSADVSVNITASPDPVVAGAPLTYTMIVSNSGPAAANSTTLTDPIATNVMFVSATTSAGSYSLAGGILTASLGTLNAGANATVTLTVIPNFVGALTNTTTVGSSTVDVFPANNSASAMAVAIPDTEPPTITAPPTVTVNTDAGQTYATGVALGTPVTADNVAVASVTNDAPDQIPFGTNIVTWTVADPSGNTASAAQLVVVSDVEKPTITLVAVTVGTDPGQCFATSVALGSPATSDNVGVASVTNNAPATFPKGTTTVTWTVTDTSGNTATATQNVLVGDAEPPTITAPADMTVNADHKKNYATHVALGSPTTADNCGVASLTNNAPTKLPVGTNTVTWTVKDTSGNVATAVQTITVVGPGVGGADLTGRWVATKFGCRTIGAAAGRCYIMGYFEVVNIGSAPTVRCRIDYYRSTDPVFDAGDTLIMTKTVKKLAPGKSLRQLFGSKLAAGDNPTGEYLIAVIDADQVQAETSKSNNIIVDAPLQ